MGWPLTGEWAPREALFVKLLWPLVYYYGYVIILSCGKQDNWRTWKRTSRRPNLAGVGKGWPSRSDNGRHVDQTWQAWARGDWPSRSDNGRHVDQTWQAWARGDQRVVVIRICKLPIFVEIRVSTTPFSEAGGSITHFQNELKETLLCGEIFCSLFVFLVHVSNIELEQWSLLSVRDRWQSQTSCEWKVFAEPCPVCELEFWKKCMFSSELSRRSNIAF